MVVSKNLQKMDIGSATAVYLYSKVGEGNIKENV